MKSELVLNWNKELGWNKNPFENDILEPVELYYSGKNAEKDNINLFLIRNQNIGIIRGERGTGKTIMLKWIESQLKLHKGKVVTNFIDYKDVNYEKEFIRQVTEPFLSGWEKNIKKIHLKLNSSNIHNFFIKKLRKKYLLLIDNMEDLTIETRNVIKALKNHPSIQLIISTNAGKLPEPDLDIGLDELPFYDARLLVERRISNAGGIGIWPFSEQMLKEIFEEADYNPRKILEMCKSKAISLALLYKRGELQKPSPEELKKQCLDKQEVTKGFSIRFGGKKKQELKLEEEKQEEEPEQEEELPSEEVSYANEIKKEILNRAAEITEPEDFEPLRAFEVEPTEVKPKKKKK